MTSDKPLPITKRMVWEAYQLVAGNGKAAGHGVGKLFPTSGKARGDS